MALTFPVASKAATIEVFDNGYGDYAPMIFNGDPTNGPGVEWILSIDGGPDLIAYCLDIYTPIDYTYYDSTITGPSGFPDGERIAWMYENYAPFVSSDAQAIALQFAIWDVAHDGGMG